MRLRYFFFCNALIFFLAATLPSFAETEKTDPPRKEKKSTGASAKVAAPPAVPVMLSSVKSRQLQKQLWFSGSIVSRQRSMLAAETPGRLIQIAEVGDYFEAGEIIARFDSTLLQKTLAEYEANAAGHRAQIQFLQKEVQRLLTLAKNNNAAISKLEENQALLAVERANLSVSIARLEQTKEKVYRMDIKAPFSGLVSRRETNLGEWLKEGDSVVELVNLDALEIKTAVSANALSFVTPGDLLTVMVGEQRFPTTLRSVVSVGDDESRLFELRLSAPPNIGKPQQIARVAVPISSARQGLVVPEDALNIRQLGITVFVVGADMIARQVPVQLGISDIDGFVEVSGALAAGDRVVVRGSERLRPGVTVRDVGQENSP